MLRRAERRAATTRRDFRVVFDWRLPAFPFHVVMHYAAAPAAHAAATAFKNLLLNNARRIYLSFFLFCFIAVLDIAVLYVEVLYGKI